MKNKSFLLSQNEVLWGGGWMPINGHMSKDFVVVESELECKHVSEEIYI